MGLFDRFIDRRVERQIDIIMQSVRRMNMQRMNLPVADAIYPDVNSETYIRDGFSGNAAVYSIQTKAAQKFAVVPLYVLKVKDKKAEKAYKTLYSDGWGQPGAVSKGLELWKKAYDEMEGAEDDDLTKLLLRPNPGEGQDQFFEKVYIYYQNGESFIWLNRGDTEGLTDEAIDKMPVLEMYALPPSLVELIPDPDDVFGILGYYFRANGAERLFVRKADMIHWKKPNPNFDALTREHLRGMSPLRPGRKKLTQNDEITDASVAMAQNGGAKGIAYDKSMGKLTPSQESQLRDVLDRKVNNSKMKAAVAALQGDWGYHDLGLSSVDMQLVEWEEKTMDALCNIFNVPPELFKTGQTYANKNEARKDLVTTNTIPARNSLRDELNRQLTPIFHPDGGYTIDNDFSQLPELQQDLKMMSEAIKDLPLTPNEKRALLNYEPMPNPNMDKIYINNSLVSIDDVGMEGFGEDVNNDVQNDFV